MRVLRTSVLGLTMLGVYVGAPQLFADQSPASVQKRHDAHKVVIQVSDGDSKKWNLALNNARNIQADLGGKNVDIEIVAYGPGIGMLKLESPVGNRVSDAMKSGVKVVACENTMRNNKLSKSDMLPKIGYVAAGVVELMDKQAAGYAYIRP